MNNNIFYIDDVKEVKVKKKKIKTWDSLITKPKDEDFFRLYKEKLEEINNKK